MKKWWFHGICMVVAGALLTVNLGCGDDNGNNGGSALTKEEQYALAQQIVDAAPGLMIQNFGSQFWDGVDPEDFTFDLFGLGKLVPERVAKLHPNALTKPIQLEADTVTFGYNPSSGWWVFHVEFSFDDDTTGIAVAITLDDSVRFQTEAGLAQLDPDENTHSFLHAGDISMQVSIDADTFGTFGVGIGGDNDFTVVGLNQSQVTVNGATGAAIDFETTSNQVQAEISMEFLGVVDDVVTDNTPESCPDDGTFSLDFEMDFVVREGGRTSRASSDWSVVVDLLGGGNAHIEVQSGDFEFESDQNICEPPL
jgi:hypothetical protein